ncbi:MAG: recombination protein RecR [Candidatus Binatota bacterium]|jgi:recombination protein RecR|nr:recombination protein RecR [Candidatus Binatota bacterium]HMF50586.1 recombination mediator RecR [Candidatus Saccharimonadales bacterium]
MTMYPAPLARLIQEMSKLPGIGEKSAARLAFHMLKGKKEDVFRLAESIGKLRQEMGLCRRCFGFSEVDPQDENGAVCDICRNAEREEDKICVVEEPADLLAVEKSQEYRGLYHVLHGTISPLDGVGPDALKVRELLERLRSGAVREVIVATNPTMDGEATAFYLSKIIKPLGVSVTRIARGLPMGGDLEYTDAVTLGKALEGRREI